MFTIFGVTVILYIIYCVLLYIQYITCTCKISSFILFLILLMDSLLKFIDKCNRYWNSLPSMFAVGFVCISHKYVVKKRVAE